MTMVAVSAPNMSRVFQRQRHVPPDDALAQAPDAVGYALAAMDATGAAVVQGHCAVRNVHDSLLTGQPLMPITEAAGIGG